jgi:hypothetical protein
LSSSNTAPSARQSCNRRTVRCPSTCKIERSGSRQIDHPRSKGTSVPAPRPDRPQWTGSVRGSRLKLGL